MTETSPGATPMIEAEGLSKFYGQFAATRDVTFSVPQGQVAAFLGPNGAGKSTTMKLLTGFLSPSEGEARIGGHDVTTDRIAAAKLIGYLPENGPLYNEMTPQSLLTYMGEARGMNRSDLRNRMDSSRRSVLSKACGARRSASCHGGIGNVWEWLRRCCTIRTS